MFFPWCVVAEVSVSSPDTASLRLYYTWAPPGVDDMMFCLHIVMLVAVLMLLLRVCWLSCRYITSMYWAYTTMTTVGYGDISSTTMAEKVWAIITMIVSGFFFSFVVGRMASLVAKMDSHRTAYNERMEVVTTFLKDTNLPRPLSKR